MRKKDWQRERFPQTWRELEIFSTLLDSMKVTPIQRTAIIEQVQALVSAVASDVECISRYRYQNIVTLIDAMLERARGRKAK